MTQRLLSSLLFPHRHGQGEQNRGTELESRLTSNRDAPFGSTDVISLVFGLSREQAQFYPGLRGYVQYLEASFPILKTPSCRPLWNAIGHEGDVTSNNCWAVFKVVVARIEQGLSDSQSLPLFSDDITRQLASGGSLVVSNSMGNDVEAEVAHDQGIVPLLVLCVLSWVTMIMSPKEILKVKVRGRAQLSIFQGSRPIQRGLPERDIAMSLAHFHRGFKVPIWKPKLQAGVYITPQPVTEFEVSCLNLVTLENILNINIVWVSDLQSHLAFDEKTNELCVFRFPSYCAASVLSGARPLAAQLFTSLLGGRVVDDTDEDYDDGEETDEEPPAGDRRQHHLQHLHFHREVLLSYRLLFGQERSSRRRAGKLLQSLKLGACNIRIEAPSDQYDDLLDVLCTMSPDNQILRSYPSDLWPVSNRSIDGKLSERSSYTVYDFPVFKDRLHALQTIVKRRPIGRITELWRDTRNTSQWLTFWAVLIIGGLSLLIGILQLIVSIAQLVISP